MAPIKFEENIKEKLDKRRLQPTSNAWDKLSNRLDDSEENNTTKLYWWLGIAASLVGIVFIVSQFFNYTSINLNSPKVVSPEIEKELIEEKPIKNLNIEVLHIKDNEGFVNTENEQQLFKNNELVNQPSFKDNIIVQEKLEPQIANKEMPSIEKTFEEQKIKDVVAQVHALSENDKEVTDETIDELLFEAQKEITLKQLINKNTGTVDANLLLQDVEAEVDQSFRSKVFEALRNSYNSVKTAVANRNE